MGAVIKHWVLTKLGLPMPEYMEPGDLRRGLSNGYLLAEILRKYSYISDDQLIALGRNFSEKTRLKNMRYVHRWMVDSGFEIDFAELLNIAEEKPGAVIKLLYRLYFLLEGSVLTCKNIDEAVPTVLQPPKNPKTEKSAKAPKKPVKVVDVRKEDPQLGAKLVGAVKQIKKCMKRQLCGKDLPQKDLCALPVPDAPAPACPCTICAQCLPPQKKCSKKKKRKECVDTKKYFTKMPCERPPVVCPLVEEPPKADAGKESKAQRKLRECPIFPIEKFPIKGDTTEAANLYFASEATLKAKEDKRALLKTLHDVKIERKVVCPGPINEFKLASILEEQKLQRLKAKVQAEFRLAKEMEKFDEMVQDPEYLNNLANRPPRDAPVQPQQRQQSDWAPIQPNFRSLQVKMQRLKCSRKEEAENAADRARLREAICAQIIKEIPCQIYDDLMETALKKAMTICGKEVELADFMVDSHEEKSLFYNHMTFEENALQRVRCDQGDKLALHRQREEDLQRTVVHTAARHSRRMTYETLLARQDAEAIRNKKIVQDILNVTVDIVTKICQYRSATGSDPPKGLLQEWKASMFLSDGAPTISGDKSGAEVDMLDQLRLNDYLFHQGEWNINLGEDFPIPQDNNILKIIVENLLETLYPTQKVLKVKKAALHSAGTFALCGVEFNWKPSLVSELLSAALPDYHFAVVDAGTTIREAVLLYAGSIEPQPSATEIQQEETVPANEDKASVNFKDMETLGEYDEEEVGEADEPVVQISIEDDLAGGGDPNSTQSIRKSGSTRAGGNLHKTKSEHSAKKGRKSVKAVQKKSSSVKDKVEAPKKGKKGAGSKNRMSQPHKDQSQFENVDASAEVILEPEDALRRSSVKNPLTPSGHEFVGGEESTIAAVVAETLLNSHPITPEDSYGNAIDGSSKVIEDSANEEFRNLGKLALDQLLLGKPVEDEITGRILAEKIRRCYPGSIIVILNYPNALCQALNFENSVKDINIDIPLCYHHVDSLIERYRQTWSEEAGDILTLAMRHAARSGGGKSRSAFFNPGENKKCNEKKKSSTFHSFLDGLIIADVNLNDKLSQFLDEDEDGGEKEDGEEEDLDETGLRKHHVVEPVPDRAEFLLHTAFLHLKRFYLKEKVAVVVPMNIDEDEYYATMAYVLQKTLAKKKQIGQDPGKIGGTEPLEDPLGPSGANEDAEEESTLEHEGSNRSLLGKENSEGILSEMSIPVNNANSQSDRENPLKDRKSKKQKVGQQDTGRKSLPPQAPTEEEEGSVDTPKLSNGRRSLKKRRPSDNISDAVENVQSPTEELSEEIIKDQGTGKEDSGSAHNKAAESGVNSSETVKEGVEVAQPEHLGKDGKPHHTKGDRYKAIIAFIPKDSMEGLGEFWMNLEQTFIIGLRGILANIRHHHDMLAQYASDFRSQFRELLERPDDRMALISEFQIEFNEILDDVREDVDVKTELHARVDELLERLEAISEEKYASSKDEIFKILNDGYLEGETIIMVNLFISLIQAETDRFCDTIQFINDFYKMSGLGLPDSVPWDELAAVDLLADIESLKKHNHNWEFEGEESVGGDGVVTEAFLTGKNHPSLVSLKVSEKGDAGTSPVSVGAESPSSQQGPKNAENASRPREASMDKPIPSKKVLPSKSFIPPENTGGGNKDAGGVLQIDQLGIPGIELNEEEYSGEFQDPANLIPSPPARSICATPSTARSWEFEVFNPDAYYDDEDINIDDSDYYEDEVTLDQISFSDEPDVDSWNEGETMFNATEEEYGTTSNSSEGEHHPQNNVKADSAVTDAESLNAEEEAEQAGGDEEEQHQRHTVEEHNEECTDESSEHAVVPQVTVDNNAASDASLGSKNKLSPQGSSSSIPESYFLAEICGDTPPLSAISSGASCLSGNENMEPRNYTGEKPSDPKEEDDLCSTSSGESCETQEELEEPSRATNTTAGKTRRDDTAEAEEEEGATEEETEIKNLIKMEEAQVKGGVGARAGPNPDGDVQATKGQEVGGEDEEEGSQTDQPGEVFIESDGGNDYDDDGADGDFDFLEPHWKFRPKRTFMDMILDSLDEAWYHFDRVVETSGENIIKVEDFVMSKIDKGSPKEPQITPSEVLEKHSKVSPPKKVKKKKSLVKGQVEEKVPAVTTSAAVIHPHSHSHFGETAKKHIKGTKRFADWEKVIQAEASRVKYQVAVIQARAVKELKQLKDIIVQVVSDAKVDASNFYIDELQSAYMACEVFRFAIENETGVQAKIMIEKDKFSIEPDTWFKKPSPLPPAPVILTTPPEGEGGSNAPSEEAGSDMKLSGEEDDEEELEVPEMKVSEKTSSNKVASPGGNLSNKGSEVGQDMAASDEEEEEEE